MKKWLGIGVLVLLVVCLIRVATCERGSIVGEDTLLLPGGYYEPCDCDLSAKDRGRLLGYVKDRYTLYLLFNVKGDNDHVYTASMGRGEFYHITWRTEVPTG